MNLYKQVDKWFKDDEKGYKPFFKNWIYFNSTPYIEGAVSMGNVPGERNLRKFIDGSKLCQLILAIDFVRMYDSTGTSEINIDIMEELDNFIRWVEDKNNNKDFPYFGDKLYVNKISVLTNSPSLLVDTNQGLGKYQIQISLQYKDEREVI